MLRQRGETTPCMECWQGQHITASCHALWLLFSALSHSVVPKAQERLCPSVWIKEEGEKGMFNAKWTLLFEWQQESGPRTAEAWAQCYFNVIESHDKAWLWQQRLTALYVGALVNDTQETRGHEDGVLHLRCDSHGRQQITSTTQPAELGCTHTQRTHLLYNSIHWWICMIEERQGSFIMKSMLVPLHAAYT